MPAINKEQIPKERIQGFLSTIKNPFPFPFLEWHSATGRRPYKERGERETRVPYIRFLFLLLIPRLGVHILYLYSDSLSPNLGNCKEI